ncbi:MAG TPA: hypothetical protein VMV92_28880 [Streptosporangiaceae bacterium]|nr:hypothetical protein [Streptosporangiaceae bacterium]
MADFSTPVRIPRAAFDQLIARIDDALGKHNVALWLHEDYPFRNLDPISSTAIDFSGIDLQDDPLDVVENLDQLLYFAFELASRKAVASWVSEYDPDLEKEAVERVEAIRKSMPNLAKLWRAKTNSVTAPLVEFTYDVVDADGTNEPYVNLYMAAARIDSSDGAPDKSDISRVRVQLWPSDVRVLMREFAHLWHAHLSDEHDQDGKGDVNGDQAGS